MRNALWAAQVNSLTSGYCKVVAPLEECTRGGLSAIGVMTIRSVGLARKPAKDEKALNTSKSDEESDVLGSQAEFLFLSLSRGLTIGFQKLQ